jgi:hypothetical protein
MKVTGLKRFLLFADHPDPHHLQRDAASDADGFATGLPHRDSSESQFHGDGSGVLRE